MDIYKLLLIAFAFLIKLSTGMAALKPSIKCQTMNGEKSFVIDQHSVAFVDQRLEGNHRSIASVSSLRTVLEGNGFTTSLSFEGKDHIIHIEDKDNFSEVDDYISITNQKGHQITFPLECQ